MMVGIWGSIVFGGGDGKERDVLLRIAVMRTRFLAESLDAVRCSSTRGTNGVAAPEQPLLGSGARARILRKRDDLLPGIHIIDHHSSLP